VAKKYISIEVYNYYLSIGERRTKKLITVDSTCDFFDSMELFINALTRLSHG
jgi:hypothetical protein